MGTVFVTGANRGIGLAMTQAFVARGDRVIATAREPDKAAALAALAQAGGRPKVLPLDVTDEKAVAGLSKILAAETVDLAIYNSGLMGSRGGLEDPGADAAEWARMLATNVTGAFLVARALLPALSRAKAGKLALISTMMASSVNAAGATYTYRVSKAALANLGVNLSVELKPRGIAVGIYHPGWVQTDMGGASAPVAPAASAQGLIARFDHLSLATTGVFEDYQGQRQVF